MDKYEVLEKKLNDIVKYIDNMTIHGEKAKKYMLTHYKKYINEIIKDAASKTLVSSNGGILGLLKGVSDYDEVCADDQLCEMLYETDNYYRYDCYKF